MRLVNASRRTARTAVLVLLVSLLPEAHAEKSATNPTTLTKTDKLMQEVVRLRVEKKMDQAFALLNSFETQIKDHSSKDYAKALLMRASVWHTMGREDEWRRTLDALMAIPKHRQIALARKAYYLAVAENRPVLDECQNCLDQIDLTKLELPDQVRAISAEYHLARRKRDNDRQLRAALEVNKLSDTRGTQLLVAVASANCGKFKDSKNWFRRAAKSGKDPSAILFTGAAIVSAAGDVNGAIELCKESSLARPGAPAPAFLLADFYAYQASQHKPTEPIKPILESIVDDKCTTQQRQEKYLRLSQDAHSKNQIQTALIYAMKANSAQSDSKSCLEIATIYKWMERYDQAADWYQKVVAAQPRDSSSLTQLAICCARIEKQEEAIEFCSRALALEPNNVLALKTRAALLIVVDRTSEAAADVKRLQLLEPEKNHSLDTLRVLGAKYTGNLMEYYHSATESWKKDDMVRLTQLEQQIANTSNKKLLAHLIQEQSRLELAVGEYAKAYEHTQKSIALGNETYRVHAIAAASLFALNRKSEAKKERQITVSLHHIQRSNNRSDGSEKISETK